jgi:hypothetical protein
MKFALAPKAKSFLFVLLCACTWASAEDLSAWRYSSVVRLNTTPTGANVSNPVQQFPVVLRLNAENFDFELAKAGGEDVRFTDEAGQALPFEVESWSKTEKSATLWVKLNTVAGNSSTQFFIMRWGNAAATSQSNPSAVFSASAKYVAVWHFASLGNCDPDGYKDATANHFDGTGYVLTGASTVEGPIGRGLRFNGSGDHIRIKNSTTGLLNFAENAPLSISAWVKADNVDHVYRNILSKGDNQYHLQLNPSGKWEFTETIQTRWEVTESAAQGAKWVHLTGVRNGPKQALYIDGKFVTEAIVSQPGAFRNPGFPVYIGSNAQTGSRFFAGSMDEIEVANEARSPDWIKLSYENQRSGQTLVKFEEEPSQWRYSANVVLNTGATGAGISEDIKEFPLLVRLREGGFPFDQARNSGEDIRFYSEDGTALPYSIERWNKSVSAAEIWVKVPLIKALNSSQFIVMRWGNPQALSRSNSAAVFGEANKYLGVWHLGEPGNCDIDGYKDATANHFDGTGFVLNGGSSVDGLIGKALKFNGSGDYIRIKNSTTGLLNFPEKGIHTISAWVKTDALDQTYRTILSKGDNQYHLQTNPDKKWEFTESNNSKWEITEVPATAAKWTYVTGVRNGASQAIYVDGVLAKETIFYKAGSVRNNSFPLYFGANAQVGSRFFSGTIDEVAIAGQARSAEWIKLSYENQRIDQTLIRVNPYPQWKFTKKIEVNTSISGVPLATPLDNFPLLVRFSAGTLQFNQVKPDGSDLRFSTSSGKPLAFEIAAWDPVRKTGEVWVNIDRIAANSSSQFIYAHWGNESAAAGGNSAEVFGTRNSFVGVWHLDAQGANSSVPDASPNHLNGVAYGLPPAAKVRGVVGSAYKFDGASSYVDFPGSSGGLLNLPEDGNYTISAWVKVAALDGKRHTVMGKGDHQFQLQVRPANDWEFSEKESSGWDVVRSVAVPNTWAHVAVVNNGTKQSLFVNGKVSDQTVENICCGGRNTSFSFNIGRNSEFLSGYFAGPIDEVTVSNTARSDEWIKLSYETQRKAESAVEIEEEQAPVSNVRITRGILALYDFHEGAGTVVHDIAGPAPVYNLEIKDPNNVKWMDGGGIEFTGNALIQGSGGAKAVRDAIAASGEFSVEAWIVPTVGSQGGAVPAQVLTFSNGPADKNFSFGQDGADMDFRLRTSTTGVGATLPAVAIPNPSGTAAVHFVITRDQTGKITVYRNGEKIATAPERIEGNLANWGEYSLALGGDVSRENFWRGKIQLVALYGRALAPAEIKANRSAGPRGAVSFAKGLLAKAAENYDTKRLVNVEATADQRTLYFSNAATGKIKALGKSPVFNDDVVSVLDNSGLEFVQIPGHEGLKFDVPDARDLGAQLTGFNLVEYAGAETNGTVITDKITVGDFRAPWSLLALFPESKLVDSRATLWIDRISSRIRKIQMIVFDDGLDEPLADGKAEQIVGEETYEINYAACLESHPPHPAGGYRYLKITTIANDGTDRMLSFSEASWLKAGLAYPNAPMTSNTAPSPMKVTSNRDVAAPPGLDPNGKPFPADTAQAWVIYNGDTGDEGLPGFIGSRNFEYVLDLGPVQRVVPDQFKMTATKMVQWSPTDFRLDVSADGVNWMKAAEIRQAVWQAGETKTFALDYDQLSGTCVPGSYTVSIPGMDGKMTSGERNFLVQRKLFPGGEIYNKIGAEYTAYVNRFPRGTDEEKRMSDAAKIAFKVGVVNAFNLRLLVKDAVARSLPGYTVNFTLKLDAQQKEPKFFFSRQPSAP